MRSVPSWLIAMFVGVGAAALAGGAGANAFTALVAAVAAGLLAQRVQRDPPWTVTGRAAWRRSWAAWSRGARGLLRARRVPPGWAGQDDPAYVPPVQAGASSSPEARAGGRVPVRCEVVTDRLQVWHSTVTQRAYEVPSERGVPGARPGSLGELVFERGRPRVVPRDLN